MKNRFYKLLKSTFLVLLILSAYRSQAQDKVISGRVFSSDEGTGLPGVAVQIKGKAEGTITDIDGKYKLAVEGSGVALSFTSVGYIAQEVEVGTQTTIDVTLQVDVKQLEEIVVVGYGEQNRRDVTGSVVSVKSEQLAQATPVSALEGMRGRLSGVNITSNGGPGEAADIVIRGTSTLNSGTGPLYVVDGQQMDNIENINPNDIASVEVLKDGSSAAIYGSQSANGVIIITTKKGEAGETKIDASYVRSYSVLASKIPVANTRQARIYQQGRRGRDTNETPADSLSGLYQVDYDLQEVVTDIGVRDQVGLSLSGGTDNAKFYWNSGYMKQEGIIKNTDFQRFNTTINVNFKVAEKIKAGTRLLASYSERNGLNEGAVLGQIATHYPFLGPTDFSGTFLPQVSSQQNVLAEALFTKRQRRDYDGQIFNYVEVDILPSLKFKTTLGVNLELQRNNDFNPTIVQRTGTPASGSEDTRLSYNIQHENYLTWRKQFGEHKVSALVGMQMQKWKQEFSRFESTSFNNDLVETFNNVQELILGANDTRTDGNSHALVSQYGRVTYDFKGKYLFAATLRRDGSSRFGAANQYGVFPAASVGWRISDEVFMDPLKNVLTDMKFRAGVATNGNERIGNYDSRPLYAPGFNYNGINGIAPTQVGNPDLLWESTSQTNIGVDLGFLGGKIEATFDYYKKTTSDLLYNRNLPQETGFNSVRSNIGSIENSGLELTISGTPLDINGFKWYTSFNIATNNNKILDLAEEDGRFFSSNNRYIYEEGEAIGNFYGYTVEGVFSYDESNAFDDDGNQLTPIFDESGDFTDTYELNGQPYTGNINQLKYQNRVLQAGNVIWKDHNGDFNITPGDDRSVIGNGVPDFFGGFYNEFKYKGFKLSVLFDYQFGQDIYRQYDETRNQRMANTVQPSGDRIDRAWLKPGDETYYPKLRPDSRNHVISNTYWINDADFIKLRSLRIDYTVPQSIVDKAKVLSRVSFYASGNNLLTWTNYEGYNPELGTRGNALQPGLDNLRYPLYREYILGVNISF